MAIFSKESLETLRTRVDLVDFLSSHIDLKRAGAAYKALCPFHDEKSPSFTIQKGDTHYHCFGCGVHGDAIHFLMNYLKMSFSDAVESLAERFHVHLEKVEGTPEQKGPPKALLKEALDHACRFFHFSLLHTPEGQNVLQYLYKRGIDLDFIRHFQVGFAPPVAGMMRKVLNGKNVKDDIMLEAGLLAYGKDGNGYRDFFSDRITFPIRDATGAVIGFSARKFKEETFGGKYVNTPETALFKKSRVLFGLNYCRKRIAKDRKAIVVEGQIDALSLIQAGFNITVAGQGTAFGEGHVKELTTLGINQVYLALDGDDAGQAATYKIGNLFQKEGVAVQVVQLPYKADPDAFLKQHGPEAFQKLMLKSIDYLSFLVQYQSRLLNMDSPAGKNELLQSIAQQVRTWEDHPVMVHESLRKLAQLTNTPENVIGVDAHVPNIYIKQSGSIGIQTIHPEKIVEADFIRWLLLMGDSKPHFIDLAKQHIQLDYLQVPVCKHVYHTYLDCHENNHGKDLLSITMRMEDPDGQAFIHELLRKMVNKDRAEQEFLGTIQNLLNRQWMEKGEEIKRKVQSGQCSDDEALDLMKQLAELKRNQPKVAPLAPLLMLK